MGIVYAGTLQTEKGEVRIVVNARSATQAAEIVGIPHNLFNQKFSDTVTSREYTVGLDNPGAAVARPTNNPKANFTLYRRPSER